jgi:hypothetical protein
MRGLPDLPDLTNLRYEVANPLTDKDNSFWKKFETDWAAGFFYSTLSEVYLVLIRVVYTYLYVFINAVISSDYVASTSRMICEYLIERMGKEVAMT